MSESHTLSHPLEVRKSFYAPLMLPYEPVRDIPNNVTCATSEDPDQPAHMCSLIRALVGR